MSNLKKILASFMVIGGLSFLTVGGAFALLTTEETNKSSSVASGTLTFQNVVNGSATVCSSYGAGSSGNVNNNCDALFLASALNYPNSPAVTTVQIANNGSIAASNLSVYMPTCTAQATPSAPVASRGGGDPCAVGGAQFYVQETTSSGTATTCWFPSGTTTCAFAASSLRTFFSNAHSAAGPLTLGSGPAAGQSRYFKIGIQLPSTASNTLQGAEALFALTWHLTA